MGIHLTGSHGDQNPEFPKGQTFVIAHRGPFRIMDSDAQPGCPFLREAIHKVRPRLTVFGHVHGSAGRVKIGETTYVNAAGRAQIYEL